MRAVQIGVAALLGMTPAMASAAEHRPPLSLQENIELVRPADVAYSSPDGTVLATVFVKGNLGENAREYSLALFQTGEVRRFINDTREALSPPAYEVLARASVTDSDYEGIRKLTWSADSRRLYFIARGMGGAKESQVFVLDLATRQLKQLTRSALAVQDFSVARNGETLAAIAKGARERYTERPAGYLVSGEYIWQVMERHDSTWAPSYSYIVSDLKSTRQVVVPLDQSLSGTLWSPSTPYVSPDGRWAIVFARVPLPERWAVYPDIAKSSAATAYFVDDHKVPQLQLMDMNDGHLRPLFDAPTPNLAVLPERFEWAAWSPDGRRVAITKSFYPTADPAHSPAAMVTATVPDGAVQRIGPAADAVTWTNEGVEAWSEGNGRSYVQRGESWQSRILRAQSRDLAISIRSSNHGEELEGFDPTSGRSRVITTLNPLLAQRFLAPVRRIEWTDRLGRIWEGQLALPADYDPTHRYPLTIGTKGAIEPRFDLGVFNAIPARELVNRRILFLQLNCEFDQKGVGTQFDLDPAVGPNESASICYDAAVDSLASKGIVDPARVGLLAFSSTGAIVQYALTQSEHVYAAASIVDSFQVTPLGYLLQFDAAEAAGLHAVEEYQQLGAPFGEAGLTNWLAKSPFFSLDRIRTPVRFEYHGTASPLGAWDTFALLRRMHRPVEMVHFPYGAHDLQSPGEILQSQSEIVDWFDFWLNDHEDSSPEKHVQYARWCEYRSQLQAIQNVPRPPRRTWSARPVTDDAKNRSLSGAD